MIGCLDGLTKEKISAVDIPRSQGKNVKTIPVDLKAIIKTPDFKINAVRTELKNLVNPNTNTFSGNKKNFKHILKKQD